MSVTYRQMQKEDIAKALPIFAEHLNETDIHWSDTLAQSHVKQMIDLPTSFCLLAEDDHSPVGFAVGRFDDTNGLKAYVLTALYVSPEYCEQGIAKVILQELESKVKESGAAAILLELSSDNAYERAFEELGYNTALKIKKI